MNQNQSSEPLIGRILDFNASFDCIFSVPKEGRLVIRHASGDRFLEDLRSMIHCIRQELTDGTGQEGMLSHRSGDAPDSIDYANNLFRTRVGKDFSDLLKKKICFELSSLLDLNHIQENCNARTHQLLLHSARLLRLACEIPVQYFSSIKKSAADISGLSRLIDFDPPQIGEPIFGESEEVSMIDQKAIEDLVFYVRELDGFSEERAFTFDSDIEFHPFSTDHIRDRTDFYGYRETKLFYMDHFSEFSGGQPVLPLFVYGPPGLGKTHFTMSMALAYQNLILVCMEKEQFENRLGELFQRLENYSYRRFVVFIDDIDPKAVDWYQFRSFVDGMMRIPQNISLIISTNFEFSSRILSRGKKLEFESMNSVIAEEMIRDYFASFSEEPPPEALVKIIAADYVNEQINGPLQELTPRSLLVYLETLERDRKRWNSLVFESGCDLQRAATDGEFDRSNREVLKNLY